MRPRLVAFDLDGTLIDSRRDLATAANDLLVRRGRPPLPEASITAMVGEGAAVLVERVFAAAGLPAPTPRDLHEFLRAYDAHLLDATAPYPGVPDMLEDAGGTAVLALVTNKPVAHTLRLLDHFGWTARFAAVHGGDGPSGRKPSPAGVLAAMATAGADADGTVLVGDSMIDVRTARAAGVRLALARYGFGAAGVPPSALRPADWTLDSPQDLARRMGQAGDEKLRV